MEQIVFLMYNSRTLSEIRDQVIPGLTSSRLLAEATSGRIKT